MLRNSRQSALGRITTTTAAAILLAFSGTASAGGDHDGHSGLYAAAAGLAIYGAIRHAGHHGGHHRDRHHSRHGGHHRRGHSSSHSGYHRERGCHRVSRHGYYHGREARIGGTQCYDRYGNPYIVRGSRYVIEYY